MPQRSVTARKDILSHVLDLDNLYSAWEDVRKNKGAPGGDLVTLARFERRLELNLSHLAERVISGDYHPGKVRMVTVYTGQKRREIAVWCVADRVLQRAVLETFERTFLPGPVQDHAAAHPAVRPEGHRHHPVLPAVQ